MELSGYFYDQRNSTIGHLTPEQLCGLQFANMQHECTQQQKNEYLVGWQLYNYIRPVAIWNSANVIFVNETCVVKRWLVQIVSGQEQHLIGEKKNCRSDNISKMDSKTNYFVAPTSKR